VAAAWIPASSGFARSIRPRSTRPVRLRRNAAHVIGQTHGAVRGFAGPDLIRSVLVLQDVNGQQIAAHLRPPISRRLR
jgi:hypothetical protein